MTNALLGTLEISLGNASAARPHMQPLLVWLAETNLGVATHPMVPYAIEALIATGEFDQARALTARFELEARRLNGPWMSMIGARSRGLLALAEGDIIGASDALAAATSYEPSDGWPFERARTLLVLGRLRRRERQKGDARRCFEAALTLFESLPAPLWAQLARAELARLGLRRSNTREMTESERRVAELAGTGLTNREVAAKLFMSPKTVEAHLARAYRKLGIRSRAELGALVASPLPDENGRS
jgi:DNA-binding CsgD family transcriptional regulator